MIVKTLHIKIDKVRPAVVLKYDDGAVNMFEGCAIDGNEILDLLAYRITQGYKIVFDT